MVGQLFGSKTRVKLLELFFSNPNRSFYVREITRKVDEQINSVRRELSNLLSVGLIVSDSSNNRLYYEVNQDYEFYTPLQQIFAQKTNKKSAKSTKPSTSSSAKKSTKSKTTSSKDSKSAKVNDAPKRPAENVQVDSGSDIIELPEAEQWHKVGNVYGVAYSGVFTRDGDAQADVVVIGDVNASKVEDVVSDLEKETKKELRYAIFGLDEWKYRAQMTDRFWAQFMDTKKQIVLDRDKLFTSKK